MANLTKLMSQIIGTVARKDFTLADLERFPHAEFSRNLGRYEEYERWYSGEFLNDYFHNGSQKVEKYPIRLNPIRSAILKHAYALFGEYSDDTGGTLVLPKVTKQDGTIDDATTHAEKVLKQLWAENNGDSKQMEAGIMAQIYGGAVFRLAYVPTDPSLETKVRIELVKNREFIGIPYHDNPWMLREAWLVREIDRRVADEYGVTIENERAYYIEYWTPTAYRVAINDIPIGFVVGPDAYIINQTNPFGFVPFVYIPHLRSGNAFWGDSLISDAVKGLTKEVNSRMADMGDAVSDDTHTIGVMSNVRGAPTVVEPIPGLKLLNISSNQGLVGGDVQPKIDFPARTKVSAPALEFVTDLYAHFRRETSIPAVADGENDASQRSSAAMSAQMWPLVAHIKQERAFWSTGLRVLARMSLRIMARHSLMGITESHVKMMVSHRWAPILPRDREQLVNELSIRAANKIGSIEHLLDLTGDVDNIDDEMKRIKAWMAFEAGLQSQAAPQPGGQPGKSSTAARAEEAGQPKGAGEQTAKPGRRA